MSDDSKQVPRREFFRVGARGVALAAVVGGTGYLATRSREARDVWQLDPSKCTQCGKCATNCVLKPSAVKCVHAFAMCGYCELCTGYFEPEPNALTTAAENQLCPVAALKRTYVEDPYFEYEVDEALCIGCGKCVEGCRSFGNGSLFLQIKHDLCVNCNQCSIARVCPSGAISRVNASGQYLFKGKDGTS